MELKIAHFTGHTDSVYSLSAGADETTFYSAGGDGRIIFWDTNDPDSGKLIAKVKSSVYSTHYIYTKNQILVAANNDGLHLIDLESNTEVWSYPAPNQRWFRMVELNGNIWISGSSGLVLIFNIAVQSIQIKYCGNSDLRSMDVAFDFKTIAMGNSNGEILFFDTFNEELSVVHKAHQSATFGIQFYPSGLRVVTSGRDAKLKLWHKNDIGNWDLEKEVSAHLFGIHDVKLHPTKPILATASNDKTIKIWDAETLKLLRVIDKTRHAGHGHSINQLLWLKKPELLLSCSDDRYISAWDIFA